ncbi:MAG: cation transporter [Pseudomonadales bacterium]|nr:cation transporter [Pseudomonadales bacterium]
MSPIRALFLLMLMVASHVWAQGPTYDIGVDGLSCPFCAYGIEKQLHKLDGVETVETDIEKAVVVVGVKDGSTLDRNQAMKAVTKAGFSLRSFKAIKDD